MPVTHGVTGSSPVRTAEPLIIEWLCFFIYLHVVGNEKIYYICNASFCYARRDLRIVSITLVYTNIVHTITT